MLKANVVRCQWILGLGCIFASFALIILIADRIVLNSPEREAKRFERELSISLPAEATVEEVITWLSARGIEAIFHRDDDGRVRAIHGDLHRDYILYWDGDMEFHFEIGKTGKATAYSVSWRNFGP